MARPSPASAILRTRKRDHIFASSTYRVRARIRRGFITKRVPPHRSAAGGLAESGPLRGTRSLPGELGLPPHRRVPHSTASPARDHGVVASRRISKGDPVGRCRRPRATPCICRLDAPRIPSSVRRSRGFDRAHLARFYRAHLARFHRAHLARFHRQIRIARDALHAPFNIALRAHHVEKFALELYERPSLVIDCPRVETRAFVKSSGLWLHFAR